MTESKKIFYTWPSFFADVSVIEEYLVPLKHIYKNIYGVPRGGLFLATLLSYKLNIPLITDPKKITKKTIVVDDISDSGDTLHRLILRLNPLVVTIFSTHLTKIVPGFFLKIKDKDDWIVFPWETEETSKYDNK